VNLPELLHTILPYFVLPNKPSTSISGIWPVVKEHEVSATTTFVDQLMSPPPPSNAPLKSLPSKKTPHRYLLSQNRHPFLVLRRILEKKAPLYQSGVSGRMRISHLGNSG